MNGQGWVSEVACATLVCERRLSVLAIPAPGAAGATVEVPKGGPAAWETRLSSLNSGKGEDA